MKFRRLMGWADEPLFMRGIGRNQGPGNALLITLEYEHFERMSARFGATTRSGGVPGIDYGASSASESQCV